MSTRSIPEDRELRSSHSIRSINIQMWINWGPRIK
jgi:hypothetical protein